MSVKRFAGKPPAVLHVVLVLGLDVHVGALAKTKFGATRLTTNWIWNGVEVTDEGSVTVKVSVHVTVSPMDAVDPPSGPVQLLLGLDIV